MDYVFSDKVSGLQASAIREILKYCAFPDIISFAAGNPAPNAFPTETIKRISDKMLSENPILALQYNITEGYTALRDTLKADMQKKGIFNPETDELIITSGAQQANEFATKVLCNEKDKLICESPSFIGSLNSFRSYNVDLIGVPLENDGMNMELLEEELKKGGVKLIYVIPNFQNPTGLTMSLEKRKALYELACKYNTMILEDNPYGDIRFAGEDIVSIKCMDTEGRVIYSGTFSKTLAPGLRVGFSVAPKPVIQKMVVCKQVSDVHTNIWSQVICDNFMKEVNMEEHLSGIRDIYRKKCDLMLSEMDKHFSKNVKYTRPEGGLFIWVSVPEGSDMMGFCKKAVEEYKVAVVPGTAFTINETDKSYSFRLNFSTPTDEQIVKGIEILGNLTKEIFGE